MSSNGKEILELLLSNTARDAVIEALRVIINLGESGKNKIGGKKSFGIGKSTDVHVLGDLQSELAMFAALHDIGVTENIVFRVYGEEIKLLLAGDIENSDATVITAVLDGIDGTSCYAKGGNSGPLLALAFGENPTYDDFFVGVVGNIPTNEVIVATEDRLEMYSRYGSELELLPSAGYFELRPDVILGDGYTLTSKNTWRHDLVKPHGGSTAYVLFKMCRAMQKGPVFNNTQYGPNNFPVGMLLDATRKRNYEQPAAYVLITKGLGGIYTTLDEVNVGSKHYLDWYMDPDPDAIQKPLIIAINDEYVRYARQNLI